MKSLIVIVIGFTQSYMPPCMVGTPVAFTLQLGSGEAGTGNHPDLGDVCS